MKQLAEEKVSQFTQFDLDLMILTWSWIFPHTGFFYKMDQGCVFLQRKLAEMQGNFQPFHQNVS